MESLPPPISEKNAASAIVFGIALLGAVVMVTWRFLLE
jgi:hypothetical protein